jgi:hypothetical protein
MPKAKVHGTAMLRSRAYGVELLHQRRGDEPARGVHVLVEERIDDDPEVRDGVGDRAGPDLSDEVAAQRDLLGDLRVLPELARGEHLDVHLAPGALRHGRGHCLPRLVQEVGGRVHVREPDFGLGSGRHCCDGGQKHGQEA